MCHKLAARCLRNLTMSLRRRGACDEGRDVGCGAGEEVVEVGGGAGAEVVEVGCGAGAEVVGVGCGAREEVVEVGGGAGEEVVEVGGGAEVGADIGRPMTREEENAYLREIPHGPILHRSRGGLATLLNLNLNSNLIIPPWISRFTSLRTLFIVRCGLVNLPDSIGDLVNLQYLDAARNRLSTLPPSMHRMNRIRFLNLSRNQFRMVPDVIQSFQRLRRLFLHKNKIQQLPLWLGDLKQLHELRVKEEEESDDTEEEPRPMTVANERDKPYERLRKDMLEHYSGLLHRYSDSKNTTIRGMSAAASGATPAPATSHAPLPCRSLKRPVSDDDHVRQTQRRNDQEFTWETWVPRATCVFCGEAPPCTCDPERIARLPESWKELVGQVTCSISHEIMRNPVATEVGSVYEGLAIVEYLRTRPQGQPARDPLTNRILQTGILRSMPFVEATLRNLWFVVNNQG
jgi:hypothetical protein